MKELVKRVVFWRANGGEWQVACVSNKIRYYNEKEREDWQTKEMTFGEAMAMIDNGGIPNARVGKTIFTGKPYIELPIDYGCDSVIYKEKEKPIIEVRVEHLLMKTASMKQLSECMFVDEFCEYLKDQGVLLKEV